MPKKSDKQPKSQLLYEKRNFWKDANQGLIDSAMVFARGFKQFLNAVKTERETVTHTVDLLKAKGFKPIDQAKKGVRVYQVFRNKTMAFAILGKRPVSEGVNMVAAHIDAPRIDLKQNPLYEDATANLGVMRTHYYGGIKKYQWVSTPLALHGVIIRADGSALHINIGDQEDEPVFIIPDLLPHLARKEQYTKLLPEAVDASKMNLVFSSRLELGSDDKEAIKLYALKLLHEMYGITEHDFISAELELVPAYKARDVGIDKSMLVGYGMDDRICGYTAMQALVDALETKPERTMVVYLSDKEEIGSVGATGAHSAFIADFLSNLLQLKGEEASSLNLRKTFINSRILSADVTAAIDPNYPNVHEKQNAATFGAGVCISKFTGAGGKYSSNDADAEFNARVISIFNQAGVFWQTGELGKVDEGGGGTIAYILANHGAQVIDCGVGLMGMHSLYELCSKADLYETYRAYKAFLLAD